MSDSDEDYMSDKILLECAQSDVRPSLLYRQNQKRSLELYKKEQETVKKPKLPEMEQERRDEGLSTAISADNKGFKMLEKMGYMPGSGLGRSFAGITEPVSIALKTNSSGLGREQHLKRVKKMVKHTKEKRSKAIEKKFRAARAKKFNAFHVQRDIYKARLMCQDLDKREGMDLPLNLQYWPKQTIADIKKSIQKKLGTYREDSTSSSSNDEEDEDIDCLLKEIITYVRSKYKYCMYCGHYIDDESDCPGYFRIDHDESGFA